MAGIGLTIVSVSYAEDSEKYKEEIKISNPDAHNTTLRACMQAALERHPGAIMQAEVESEGGKTIIDVDIHGSDGKSWEIECDATAGFVLKDEEESDDKKEAEKK